jgi:hypothetical protein
MVVPDKTTTYVEPEHSASFVSELNRTHLGPDLFTAVKEAQATIRDLYFPTTRTCPCMASYGSAS